MAEHLAIIFHLLAFVKYLLRAAGLIISEKYDRWIIYYNTIFLIALLVIGCSIYKQKPTGCIIMSVNC